MIVAKESVTLPGDKVAYIEEFEGADGTYESDGVVRSSRKARRSSILRREL